MTLTNPGLMTLINDTLRQAQGEGTLQLSYQVGTSHWLWYNYWGKVTTVVPAFAGT